ncbi:hypothetical protein PR001_g24553 [Phytophthora rubi]|uniref:Uncharacterized protein n=1 Tax=Phytophthora rubi TaxID=129364 RepID=A0A6A3IBS7_9STRA|nr:hypothetical protein PR001_g24553 [Phytophthora rubi]
MDTKAREAIVVGYSRERRGYRLLDSNTRTAYYSHTVVFREKKADRIAKGATPELVSDVSTQQYLGIDSATMETIPSMLDEAHHNERCDSESSAVGSEHQNRSGGADGARSARSGGAAEEARSGGAVATEVAVENTRSGGTVVTRSGGAVATQKRKRSEAEVLWRVKQAPRVWFQLLKAFLEDQDFSLLKSEACVAVKVIDGQVVFIPLYVDDLVLFAPNIKLINEMKRMFIERFEMKDLGELHYILG